ncbi:G-protein coupled receptor 55 [Sardina pilchardus]|uniref:G-protein coupled receptor 55 n=1 Tax=Sardina pilchardus TaxID=27697 RepID=UPI002E138490
MTENCSMVHVEVLMQSVQLVIYVPTFVFGLVLNTLALVVFCVLRKWNESTIYMTNLALMDLLLLLLLPFKMHAVNNQWNPSMKLFCSFLESMYFVGMYGSIYTITCIAMDRYVAIQHPMRAKEFRSPKAAIIICVVIWFLALGATSPVYSFHNDKEEKFRCFHGFSDAGWKPALIGCVEVFGFLLPAAVVVVCSIKSIRTLKQSQGQSVKSRAGERILYSSVCAFLVPFTPYHLGVFLQFLVRRESITACQSKTSIALFVQIAMCLANVTCCLDALCYYFIVKEVRCSKDTIRRSISKRTTSTSEV